MMIEKKIRLVPNKATDFDYTEQELMQAPDGYFEEIFVLDVLESSKTEDIFEKICSKVRKGGSITIQGYEFVDMCRRVVYGEIPDEHAKIFLRSSNNISSVSSLQSRFSSMGWNVRLAGCLDGRYKMEVIRP